MVESQLGRAGGCVGESRGGRGPGVVAGAVLGGLGRV